MPTPDRPTFPDADSQGRLRNTMTLVLLALLPGALALFGFFGWGVLISWLLACSSALLVEAAVLRVRGQAVSKTLGDGSAWVSATLLALALPAYAPWWVTVSASAFALLFGKHLYGGVGKNPFNPAMLGYAFALIAFPQAMNHWPSLHVPSLAGSLQQIFGSELSGSTAPDAWVQATALDTLRTNKSLTIDELFASHGGFGTLGGNGQEWVSMGFLAGGAWLLHRRVIGWQAPVGMLGSLLLISLLCWNGSGSDSHGSPLFHLFSGASMLGAFFIVTEPVSGPSAPRARLMFGVGAGLITYAIRTWGGYPDGVAFAVLLMNMSVPALERLASRTTRETAA